MNVIIVDDERLVLAAETTVIKKALPQAKLASFRDNQSAAEYASRNPIDVAFLDIQMRGFTGLELARQLIAMNPKINIIFCTGYAEYSLEAFSLYASGYLLKPITVEKVLDAMAHLRFPPPHEMPLVIRCFGNFEVLCNGVPVKFKHIRTRELLAYLVDRKGALVSTNEAMAAMFGDEDKGSYMRTLKADLINTFSELGLEDVLIQHNKQIGILCDQVSCDYFDYLNGRKDLFRGEYMTQFTFGEETLARLLYHS